MHVKVVSAPISEEIAGWEGLVQCLPGLPTVEELELSCWDERFLESPETDEQDEGSASSDARYDELRLAVVDLLRGVKTLTMRGADAGDAFTHLIKACPPPNVFALERLVLETNAVSSLDDLPRVARLMPNLRTLEVRIQFLDADIDVPSVSFDNLKHLSIRIRNHARATILLQLGQINNTTLETLSLTTTESLGEDHVPAFPPFTATYPRLRKLSIDPWHKATLEGGRALLASITPERFPNLQVLAVRKDRAFAAESDLPPAFQQLLARPGFRLCEPVTHAARTYNLIKYETGPVAFEQVQRRNPTVSQGVLDEILCSHSARDVTSFARGSKLRRQLDDTAGFFADSLSAATARNDFTALGRLAQAAKGLVMEQMFMET